MVDFARVGVAIHDSKGVWSYLEKEVMQYLPHALRNLAWKSVSSSRERRMQCNVEVQFVPVIGNDFFLDNTPPAYWFLKPYVHFIIVSAEDVDAYRQNIRGHLKLLTDKLVDMRCEYLVLYVPLPTSSKNRFEMVGFGSKTRVFDKLKADLNKDRCMKIELQTDDQRFLNQWEDLLQRLKELLVSAFEMRSQLFDLQIVKMLANSGMPGWSYCKYFSVKEGLLGMYQQLQLHDEALRGYDELQDYFTRYGQIRQTFPKFGAKDAGDDGGVVLDLARKQLREQIVSGSISFFDFCMYLFGRQCKILLTLGRPGQMLHRALKFIRQFARFMEQLPESEGPSLAFVDAWVFSTVMHVVEQCSQCPSNISDTEITPPALPFEKHVTSDQSPQHTPQQRTARSATVPSFASVASSLVDHDAPPLAMVRTTTPTSVVTASMSPPVTPTRERSPTTPAVQSEADITGNVWAKPETDQEDSATAKNISQAVDDGEPLQTATTQVEPFAETATNETAVVNQNDAAVANAADSTASKTDTSDDVQGEGGAADQTTTTHETADSEAQQQPTQHTDPPSASADETQAVADHSTTATKSTDDEATTHASTIRLTPNTSSTEIANARKQSQANLVLEENIGSSGLASRGSTGTIPETEVPDAMSDMSEVAHIPKSAPKPSLLTSPAITPITSLPTTPTSQNTTAATATNTPTNPTQSPAIVAQNTPAAAASNAGTAIAGTTPAARRYTEEDRERMLGHMYALALEKISRLFQEDGPKPSEWGFVPTNEQLRAATESPEASSALKMTICTSIRACYHSCSHFRQATRYMGILAQIHMEQGHYKEAKQLLEKQAKALAKDHWPALWFACYSRLLECYEKLGNVHHLIAGCLPFLHPQSPASEQQRRDLTTKMFATADALEGPMHSALFPAVVLAETPVEMIVREGDAVKLEIRVISRFVDLIEVQSIRLAVAHESAQVEARHPKPDNPDNWRGAHIDFANFDSDQITWLYSVGPLTLVPGTQKINLYHHQLVDDGLHVGEFVVFSFVNHPKLFLGSPVDSHLIHLHVTPSTAQATLACHTDDDVLVTQAPQRVILRIYSHTDSLSSALLSLVPLDVSPITLHPHSKPSNETAPPGSALIASLAFVSATCVSTNLQSAVGGGTNSTEEGIGAEADTQSQTKNVVEMTYTKTVDTWQCNFASIQKHHCTEIVLSVQSPLPLVWEGQLCLTYTNSLGRRVDVSQQIYLRFENPFALHHHITALTPQPQDLSSSWNMVQGALTNTHSSVILIKSCETLCPNGVSVFDTFGALSFLEGQRLQPNDVHAFAIHCAIAPQNELQRVSQGEGFGIKLTFQLISSDTSPEESAEDTIPFVKTLQTHVAVQKFPRPTHTEEWLEMLVGLPDVCEVGSPVDAHVILSHHQHNETNETKLRASIGLVCGVQNDSHEWMVCGNTIVRVPLETKGSCKLAFSLVPTVSGSLRPPTFFVRAHTNEHEAEANHSTDSNGTMQVISRVGCLDDFAGKRQTGFTISDVVDCAVTVWPAQHGKVASVPCPLSTLAPSV